MPATNPTDAPFLRPVRDDTEHAAVPARLRTHWTADELMAMQFTPPVWAVPGIICEGVNLLCGPPKVGKSWASLGLGLAVSAGTHAFDAIPVEGGPVLYLALEDTPRRLQTRMRKILGGQPAAHRRHRLGQAQGPRPPDPALPLDHLVNTRNQLNQLI